MKFYLLEVYRHRIQSCCGGYLRGQHNVACLTIYLNHCVRAYTSFQVLASCGMEINSLIKLTRFRESRLRNLKVRSFLSWDDHGHAHEVQQTLVIKLPSFRTWYLHLDGSDHIGSFETFMYSFSPIDCPGGHERQF